MLQRVVRQLRGAGLAENITVVTGAAQRAQVLEQLGADTVQLITEPARRGTFSAIALACAYLHFARGCSPDEHILVLPVDSYVDDDYFALLASLDDALTTHASADMILVGAKPTYPSEKYGYIVPASGEDVPAVLRFREKPRERDAAALIAQGALWNCGVFAFRLQTLLAQSRRRMDYTSYTQVRTSYEELDAGSLDKVVLEQPGITARVLRYGGAWMDIGTWNTLADVLSADSFGNVRMSEDCRRTQVLNTTQLPVVVMGAKDMVVVVSEQGILVADKVRSSYVLEMLD